MFQAVLKRVESHDIPTSGSSRRIEWIECLRLAAMFEIVAAHLYDPLPLLDGLGLPIFLLLSIAFSVTSVERRGLPAIISGKLRRIGLPWVFWSGVYALFMSLLAVRHGRSPAEVFSPLMMLYGTSIHLWFCPFIIVAGVAAARIHLKLRWNTDQWRTWSTVVFAYAFLLVIGSEGLIRGYRLEQLPVPFWQWYFSLPSLILGLAMGWILLLSRGDPRWLDRFAWITAVIAGVSIAFLSVEHLFRRYSVSLAVIAVAFALGRRYVSRRRTWTRLSSMVLGVYLIHVLFGYLMYKPFNENGPLYTTIVYLVSFAAVAVLQRTKLRVFV